MEHKHNGEFIVLLEKIEELFERVENIEKQIKENKDRVENIEKQMKEDKEEQLKKLKAELDFAKFRCALPTILDMMQHD